MARHPVRRALGFLFGFALLFFLAVFAVALLHDRPSGPISLSGERVVGVVPLDGEISRSDDFVETMRDLADRSRIAAVVVRINSPGGAVAPSQEMYAALRRLAEKKPVIASLGSIAASGGYYVASAADVIVASPGTLTGSIGVVMSLANVNGLMEKLGVQSNVITAGSLKDMGSPFRPMTPDERALFQQMLDQVHTQFIDAVAAGRKMDPEQARKLADGRVYTGEQAKAMGLVDELGGLEKAVEIAGQRSGIVGEPTIERVSLRRWPWWMRAAFSDDSESPVPPSGLVGFLLSLAAAADHPGSPAQATLLWRMPMVTDGIRW
jgi:protease IV